MRNPATIWVKFQCEGWHQWKDAPVPREYLAAEHRHQFHFKVSMSVAGDDRVVEFHDLIDEARAYVAMIGPHFGGRSCEMIARETAEWLSQRYGTSVTVECSEDGECGAVVSVDAQVRLGGQDHRPG